MKRKFGIRLKLILCFIVFAVILASAITAFHYYSILNEYTEFYSNSLQKMVSAISASIDGDTVEKYANTMKPDSNYDELKSQLNDLKAGTELMYLYVFIPETDSFTYIVEAELPDDDPNLINELGDVYNYKSLEYEYLLPDVMTESASTELVVMADADNEYGRVVEAWAPIYNSKGEFVAMLEGDMSLDDVIRTAREAVIPSMLMTVAIVAFGVIILTLVTKRIVINPLNTLTHEVAGFLSGDTPHYEQTLQTNDEFMTLSEAFGKMTDDLTGYTKRVASIAASEERMASAMNLVRGIENSVLPKPIIDRNDYCAAGMLHSSHEVGGGFYDFFPIGASTVGIVTAGMGRTGISAALYSIVTKTMIKGYLQQGKAVGETVNAINTALYDNNPDAAISAFIGVLDLTDGTLSYVNAGYASPVHKLGGGGYSFLPEILSQQLAVNRNVSFKQNECRLSEGDSIIIFSGGMLNAINNEQRFSENRLPRLLNSKLEQLNGVTETLNSIMTDFDSFSEGQSSSSASAMSVIVTYYGSKKSRVEVVLPPKSESFADIIPELKKQFQANSLPGMFYAEFTVALEELFVLCCGKATTGNYITMQSYVAQGTVTVSLSYYGIAENPLTTKNKVEMTALDFIAKHGGQLDYERRGEKNIITLTRVA